MPKNFLKIFLYPITIFSLIYFFYSLIYFFFFDNLPTPFFYNNADLFMDYYNVNYHSSFSFAYAYSEWKTVYTPFQILISGIIDLLSVQQPGATLYRDANIFQIYFIFASAFFAVILIFFNNVKYINNIKFDNFLNTHLCLLIFLICCFPILYTISRGNYIILSLIFFSLFLISNDKYLTLIFLSLMVLIKPYLILLFSFYLIKKDYESLFLSFLFIGIIFIASSMIIPEEKILQKFIMNYMLFGANADFSFQGINYNFSFALPINFLASMIGSNTFYLNISLTFLCISFFIIFLYRNYKKLDDNTLIFLILVHIILLIPSAGGYSFVLMLPLLHIFYINNNKFILYVLFFLLFPWDVIIYKSIDNITYEGIIVTPNSSFEITFLAIFRPALLLLLIFGVYYLYENKKKSQ